MPTTQPSRATGAATPPRSPTRSRTCSSTAVQRDVEAGPGLHPGRADRHPQLDDDGPARCPDRQRPAHPPRAEPAAGPGLRPERVASSQIVTNFGGLLERHVRYRPTIRFRRRRGGGWRPRRQSWRAASPAAVPVAAPARDFTTRRSPGASRPRRRSLAPGPQSRIDQDAVFTRKDAFQGTLTPDYAPSNNSDTRLNLGAGSDIQVNLDIQTVPGPNGTAQEATNDFYIESPQVTGFSLAEDGSFSLGGSGFRPAGRGRILVHHHIPTAAGRAHHRGRVRRRRHAHLHRAGRHGHRRCRLLPAQIKAPVEPSPKPGAQLLLAAAGRGPGRPDPGHRAAVGPVPARPGGDQHRLRAGQQLLDHFGPAQDHRERPGAAGRLQHRGHDRRRPARSRPTSDRQPRQHRARPGLRRPPGS